ncbi:MAG: hypothetical protein ACYC1S_13135 [Gemmatimonadaceae bacterium]
MHASSRSLAGALALAFLAAIPAGAQQASAIAGPADAPTAAPAAAAPAAGPTVEQAAVAVRAPAQAQEQQASAAAARSGLGTARAQMIVGFAALVAGAIIGGTPGTLIMITGAAVGLWGLYNYLQ